MKNFQRMDILKSMINTDIGIFNQASCWGIKDKEKIQLTYFVSQLRNSQSLAKESFWWKIGLFLINGSGLFLYLVDINMIINFLSSVAFCNKFTPPWQRITIGDSKHFDCTWHENLVASRQLARNFIALNIIGSSQSHAKEIVRQQMTWTEHV